MLAVWVVQVTAEKDRCTVGHGHGTRGDGAGAVPQMEGGVLVDPAVEVLVERELGEAISDDAGAGFDLFENAPSFACAEGVGFVLFTEGR